LWATNPSNAVTSVKAPEGIDGGKIVKTIKSEYGITIAGGQEHLNGKIFRLSHLGYYDYLDMVTLISAVEGTLAKVGYNVEVGAGVKAVQEILIAE